MPDSPSSESRDPTDDVVADDANATDGAHDVTWTEIACPLCGSEQARPVLVDRVRLKGHTYEFHEVACVQCTCVYVNPRGSGDVFGAEAGGAARTDAAVANQPIYKSGLAGLRDAGLSERGQILDLGCARGDFLQFAADAGFGAIGVDINPTMADHARSRGYEVFTGDLRELDLGRQFDAVTMWDVIEHVDDPVELLTTCRRVLAPGGLLLFHTGNARFQIPKARILNRLRPTGGPYLIPYQHLVNFDPRTARSALERAGFDPVAVYSAGTLHYRRPLKRAAMRTINAVGALPPIAGGPLLTNAMAAIGRAPV